MYALLYNPNARGTNVLQKEQLIAETKKRRGKIFCLYQTDSVIPVLEQLKMEGIKNIVLAGGDGTIRNFATQVRIHGNGIADDFHILPLPSGTINLMPPLITGLHGSPLSFLRRFDPQKMQRKTIRPLVLQQGDREWIGFSMIFGAVARVIEHVYDRDHTVGKAIGNFCTGIFAGFTGWPESYARHYEKMGVSLKIDEKQMDHTETMGVLLSVFSGLIFGLKPFPEKNPDKIRVLSYDIRPQQVVWPANLWKIFTGRVDTQDPRYINTGCDTVEIVTPEKYLNIDGNTCHITPGIPLTAKKGPSLNFFSRT